MKLERCDARPRIYIATRENGADWSLAPTALRRAAVTPGHALDAALEQLGKEAGRGAVVILERMG